MDGLGECCGRRVGDIENCDGCRYLGGTFRRVGGAPETGVGISDTGVYGLVGGL